MFLDFYNLREQPFGVTPEPRFLFLGASHREALASLFCGVEADRGFIVLTAHPGMGKTTLTFQLLEKLRRTARTSFVFQTQCNSREFFQYLLDDLDADSAGMDFVSMHNKLNDILFQEWQAGRRVVLAIDEAQNLDSAVLETIRLLSNFEKPGAKLLQIVLIGQPQLAHKLADPALLQLKQRIAVFARIEPFNPEDTSRYIAHRLEVAGYCGNSLFTAGALRLIAERSQGIPRNINNLCFSALSLGCAMGRKRIDVELIREASADLEPEANRAPIQIVASAAKLAPEQVLSYQMESAKSIGRFALAAICVAACIAIGVAAIPSSRAWMARFWPHDAQAAGSRLNPGISLLSAVDAPFSSYDVSSTSYAIHADRSAMKSAMVASDDPKTINVVVQPGETLRQITLRTMGQYNEKAIEQIQHLNPGLTDPNHIEANQRIRVPRPSGSPNIADVSRANRVSDNY